MTEIESIVLTTNDRKALVQSVNKLAALRYGEIECRFEFEELDDEFMTKARTELRETDEIVAESLAEIRKLAKGEENLVVPDFDEFYKKFLRPCSWNTNSAFNFLKNYYQFRVKYAQTLKNLSPKNDHLMIGLGLIAVLPMRCKDGARVILIQANRRWNPTVSNLESSFRVLNILIEILTNEPKTQVCGYHLIFEMDGFSLTHAMQFTPSFAKMALEWVQKCLPLDIKGVHFVNQPYIFNMVFAIFKPFIDEKLRKRIHFHGTDRKSLMKLISGNTIPKYIGGELDLNVEEDVKDQLANYLINFEAEFQNNKKYGYVNKEGE